MSDERFTPATGEWVEPADDIARKAHVPDYRRVYERAMQDIEAFWAERAATLDWYEPWQQVLDRSEAPFFRWFTGGKTNIVLNALDRHIHTPRRNKLALLWEGEPGDRQSFSYWQLWQETNRYANVLRGLGVRRGGSWS